MMEDWTDAEVRRLFLSLAEPFMTRKEPETLFDALDQLERGIALCRVMQEMRRRTL